jgi:hypothetical protein
MAKPPRISLVLADVDGTLVTEEKILTKRAQAAVHRLHDAGIRFAITSGRPPKGMSMLFDPLKLETPIAGFNGGLFVKRDLSIVEQPCRPISQPRPMPRPPSASARRRPAPSPITSTSPIRTPTRAPSSTICPAGWAYRQRRSPPSAISRTTS